MGSTKELLEGGRRRRDWAVGGIVGGMTLLVAGAGAAAAVEDATVGSFGDGLMWAITLMTTAGFVDGPPSTTVGKVVAVVLMVAGFLLLSLASAVLAAAFVRDDSSEVDRVELGQADEILARLEDISARLAQLEAAHRTDPPGD